MRDYHDEDYDGVVLKIPSWFIKMNNLEDAFKAFQVALESADKSMYYPDHVKNIYELNNIDTKIKEVSRIREEEKNREKIITERNDKIHSGEMYQLEWVERKSLFDGALRLPNGERYNWDEIFTKRGIKASFQKEFNKHVNNFESLKVLSELNPHNAILSSDMQGATADLIQSDYQLYQSTQGWEVFGISYRRLCVRTDWSIGRKRGWLYRLNNLIVHPDGCFAIHSVNNIEKAKRLEGYERSQGIYLIKR